MVPPGRAAAAVLSVVAVLLATQVGATVGSAHVETAAASAGNDTGVAPGTHAAPASTEATNATPTVNRTGESTVRIRAGEEDAHLLIALDFSLFARMPGPGRLGFDSAGLLAGERVVSVELGLRFLGVGNPLTFLGNPSSRFTVEARSELSLPFLAEPGGDVGVAR